MRPPVVEWIVEALRAHGIDTDLVDATALVRGGLLGFSAEVYDQESTEGSARVVLEILASAPALGGSPIVECFVGWGEDAEVAARDAFGKFLLGGFHVLIEALAPHDCECPQADQEVWEGRQGRWRVFSGPLVTQQSTESRLAPDYGLFLTRLQAEFEAHAEGGVHWIRVFLGGFNGAVAGSEVLVDNEEWEVGHRVLLAHDWDCPDEYQSFRHFMLLLPEGEQPMEPVRPQERAGLGALVRKVRRRFG